MRARLIIRIASFWRAAKRLLRALTAWLAARRWPSEFTASVSINAAGGVVEATAIPVNMAGFMFAMPDAPLTGRPRGQGRLPTDDGTVIGHDGDHCTAGLNFEPFSIDGRERAFVRA